MEGTILAARIDAIEYIKFTGVVRYSHCAGLESHLDKIFSDTQVKEVVVDLDNAEILDSTALGLLARIAIETKKETTFKPVIFVRKGELHNILKRVCFDQVFNIIIDNKLEVLDNFTELDSSPQNEQEILQRVVKAHENLAIIDASNEQLFKDITNAIS